MSARSRLKSWAGNWHGTYRLHNPETNLPEQSESRLRWTPILNDRFVRVEYTWQYQGTKQDGLFLIGYEEDTRTITLHWIDTWHMGDKVMACRGNTDENGGIALLGSYSVPDNPDWGWRILILPGVEQTLRIEMQNIAPDGQEYPAIESVYSRS